MKKYIRLLSQLVLISTFGLSPIACSIIIKIGDDNREPGKPEIPKEKDIEYYQSLIKTNEEYIKDCDEWIADIKKEVDEGETSRAEAEIAIDQITAEKYLYKAEINEWQYQILLLEKERDKFTLEQIRQGIAIFTEKNINLEAELKLKEKYPEDYSKLELQKIKDEIKVAIDKLNYFLDLKNKEEEK